MEDMSRVEVVRILCKYELARMIVTHATETEVDKIVQ